MAYKHLFGPVPSRRLGVSLGIDLVPHKVCSLDCIYCECGSTNNLTVNRQEFVPYTEIINELIHFFSNHPQPDYLTFSGSGEPTLNCRIGEVIDYLKQHYPEVPVAVLTNGTLLDRSSVRSELMSADLVLPSLDAATEKAFYRINRPASGLTVAKHIKGMAQFSKKFSGQIWLEVFILPGYNDDTENLEMLKNSIQEIKPDKIQLNTLDRPGTVNRIYPASAQLLEEIKEKWNLPGLELIAAASSRKQTGSFSEDIEQAILETITRRPCTLSDLSSILNLHINELNKYLATLETDGFINSVSMDRGVFYQVRRT